MSKGSRFGEINRNSNGIRYSIYHDLVAQVPTEWKTNTKGNTLATMFLSWGIFFYGFPIKTLVFLMGQSFL